jgi:O-methyltransferase
MSSTLYESIQLGIHRAASRFGFGLTNYRHALRQSAWRDTLSANSIQGGTTPLECIELHQAVAACEKIEGDLAEAGVYKGATAAVMLCASQRKLLHLFDTFEGLPNSENQFKEGSWRGTLGDVISNLGKWQNRAMYHPGLFPKSAVGLENVRFSFVHLDLDLYESTSAALSWFWPRLTVGGAILSHDYPLSPGVVRAFDEFFSALPSTVFIPLSGHQCIAIKTV